MRALDSRLLRYARATRVFLFVSVGLGVLSALLIVTQAWLLADVVAGAFRSGKGLAQLQTQLIVLLGVVLARAVVAWGAELAASRSSARAKSQLRAALLERLAALGVESSRTRRTSDRVGQTPRSGGQAGELAILATRGIDALDGYFSLYLPQLFLAVIVPLVVLAVVLVEDWISAAIIAVTVPLIPLFMALVGATTRERMDRQVRTLERLAGHFLDVVAGLPTLKIFGRAKAQARAIAEITDRYRRSALAALRVAFLSSLILELVATISVALVAVAIGLRLMSGSLDFRSALFVLVLAPEAYLPLRQLGANYHASAEGMAAAERVFEMIERPAAPRGLRTDVPDPARVGLAVEGLRVSYPDRGEPALDGVSLAVEPGEVLALVGPGGCGKSTLLSVLLGFVAPEHGSVRVGEVDLAELDPDAWRARIAWMPQRPHLFAASIAENVRLGRSEASEDEVQAAVAAAGLDGVVAKLPAGMQTVLGDRGAGLSAGERQRVALARAFLRDSPLLLLDEPTANLDGETEHEVLEAVRRLAQGRTVVLVAHRPALLGLADRVLSLAPVEVAA
ncbi:MAG TPA: thiol reductant ABC exporter subunit CydD [Solirubrobacteraceae bacterium]|jgi:thiol reductant ABC exporter CydD subunit